MEMLRWVSHKRGKLLKMDCVERPQPGILASTELGYYRDAVRETSLDASGLYHPCRNPNRSRRGDHGYPSGADFGPEMETSCFLELIDRKAAAEVDVVTRRRL